MRNLILSAVALATLASPLAAQTYPGEIRDGRREVAREYRDLQDARRYGDRDDIREERGEYRDARRELRQDLRERDRDGIYRDGRGEGFYGDRGQRRYQGERYYYPRGYGYRSYNVGTYLPRAYWGDRYYIGRPAQYGLTGAWRGTRWVRVGSDAVLIRIRNGSIVKVVRGLYY